MTAPALQAYVQGEGNVGADNLNTFEQSCDTFSDLRSFIGVTGIQVFSRGGIAINDGLQGPFYWDASSAADDDGLNVIAPLGAADMGRWVRIAESTTAIDFTAYVQASEAIPVGYFVNVFNSSGSTRVRLADASDPTKFANGFAFATIASGDTGLIVFFGFDSTITVAAPASQVWLSDTVPGFYQTSAPVTSGHIVQSLGVAIPGAGIFFTPNRWTVL